MLKKDDYGQAFHYVINNNKSAFLRGGRYFCGCNVAEQNVMCLFAVLYCFPCDPSWLCSERPKSKETIA